MKNSRFQNLPVHHIDTSVILEPKDTENGFYCKKYLNLVGYKYRGKFSLPVFGELLFKIQKLETTKEQYDLLDSIIGTIRARKVSFFPIPDSEGAAARIRELDERIHKVDRLIFACAAEDHATAFVTLDRNLIDNSILEKEFGVRIKHPKDLL